MTGIWAIKNPRKCCTNERPTLLDIFRGIRDDNGKVDSDVKAYNLCNPRKYY
jgi:hypothetical protein